MDTILPDNIESLKSELEPTIVGFVGQTRSCPKNVRYIFQQTAAKRKNGFLLFFHAWMDTDTQSWSNQRHHILMSSIIWSLKCKRNSHFSPLKVILIHILDTFFFFWLYHIYFFLLKIKNSQLYFYKIKIMIELHNGLICFVDIHGL